MINDKQKIFCDEYLKDFNATRAAQVAGYSQKNAKISGARLLTYADVQVYLAEKKQAIAKKAEVTLEMVVEGYRRLAFFDSRKFYDENGNLKKVVDLDDETAYALSGMEVSTIHTDYGAKINTNKIKMSERNKALDSLCRVLGYNAPDKTAFVNPDGSPAKPMQLLSDEQFAKLLENLNK